MRIRIRQVLPQRGAVDYWQEKTSVSAMLARGDGPPAAQHANLNLPVHLEVCDLREFQEAQLFRQLPPAAQGKTLAIGCKFPRDTACQRAYQNADHLPQEFRSQCRQSDLVDH